MIMSKLARFFASSLVLGLGFTLFKLPPLLGYILAGVVLGPYVTKFMGDSIEYITVLGELGLVMLLFVAGLELHINDFIDENNTWLKIIGEIAGQILVSFTLVLGLWLIPDSIITNYWWLTAILAGGCALLYGSVRIAISKVAYQIFFVGIAPLLILLISLAIKFKWIIPNSVFTLPTVILCGCILALNSTAVVIKLLDDRDKKKPGISNNLIGILIGQDLACIAMIVALQGMTESVSLVTFGIRVILGVGGLYLVKLASDYKPTVISDSVDYIFGLSMELGILLVVTLCFGCATIAEMVGLSDVYGSFLVGLLLGNAYKHHKDILKLCQPISNILITLFFIWAGAMLNLQDLLQNWLIIAIVTGGIFAFKYFTNYHIIRFMSFEDSTPPANGSVALSASLLTQVSEFSLVLIAIVAKGNTDTGLCDIMKSCTIVLLSVGSVLTVLLKNGLYNIGYIEDEVGKLSNE